MSYRDTYLSALKDEIETTIVSADSNYSTTIKEVKRGIYIWEDFNSYPSMSIRFKTDDVLEAYGCSSGMRQMNIDLTLYVQPDNVDDREELDLFIRDIHYFLETDYSYHSNVIIDDFEIYEGNENDPVHEARISIGIIYSVSTI